MHLTQYEKETIILFNEAEDTATCDTCNPTLIRKLDGFCLESTEISLVREDEHGKTYKFPKRWVKVRMPMKLSEEQRAKRAETLKKNTDNSK